MTYEQALQIAIEELYDSVEYLKAMNKGFPRVEAQCNELMEAHNLLRKELQDADAKREWVWLTDEEVGTLTVFDGLHNVETPLLTDFARAIEAKLKEKNA